MDQIVDICEKKWTSTGAFSVDNFKIELWYGATLELKPLVDKFIQVSDLITFGEKYSTELTQLRETGILTYVRQSYIASHFVASSLWQPIGKTDRFYFIGNRYQDEE